MNQNPIKPPRLQKGDTIGIISPSQAVNIEEEHIKGFKRGVQRLLNLGYKVKLGEFAKNKYFYSAGTPEQRVKDLHDMFQDPQVKAILMSIGGETANEVLPLLDFELIRNNPKILLGMSDGTTLLAPITNQTGLVTFYGPDLIYGFGIQKDMEKFEEQMFKCLNDGIAEFNPIRNLTDERGTKLPNGWANIRPGKTTGKLIGGYLEIIMALIGAKFLDNLQGSILFLESMESANIIHMRLQFLKLMGVFDQINGLILGYFPDVKSDKKYYRPIGDIIFEIAKDKNFPILQVNELGHETKNYTWPMGIEVELDSNNKTITALESCVS